MTRWNIYHAGREYAHEHGDPLLGTVWASSKQEAERIAMEELEAFLPTGAWAMLASLEEAVDAL